MIQANNVRSGPVTKLRDVKKCTGSIMCELHERHVANMKEDAETAVATVTLAWEGALKDYADAVERVVLRDQQIADRDKLVERHKRHFHLALFAMGLVIAWAWYQVRGGM